MKRIENLLLVAWGQALIATLGSLFFSEIMKFVPCELCWFQRVLMYPLVVIYGLAVAKKDARIAYSGLFMSGIGILVAVYHYGVQKLPALQETGGACGIIPCTTQFINYGGFITIPFLSLLAFTVIFLTHLVLLRTIKESS
ncbi:dihydroneopterin aldolase [Pontibacillus halophilus JSM 076056 = DSM 19796]|uniref:Probable disulfide formation protein n=1 Tax=Pontibacillus halophilus JSM 076056 = DSM 19796 TaxID=1385510 RepID=A0A0A5GN12_9BACI|nr:disulfide oxidoreductase [Pontibacillus halophilus]KGX92618.1 dihydroneopterin aldolase [Pontibacillus halophilus JSM 076056 = DSM 19796]